MLKPLSITELKKMPFKTLLRLLSRYELEITQYGKPRAIMTPMGPYFSTSKLRDIERQLNKCDHEQKDSNAAELFRELRVAQEKEALRRMGKLNDARTPKKRP